MKNAWFKHYNTASQGSTLRSLWDNKDYEAYGLFWRMLEFVSMWEKEESRGEILISINTIARETGWKPTKCLRVLSRICSVSQIEMEEKNDGNISFLVPNWLELQENRGGKREPKKDQKHDRSKKEDVRCKNEEERVREKPSSDGLPRLAIIWNENCGKLAKVTKTNPSRNKRAAERLKEDDESGWIEAVKKLSASPFCNGMNDRGWKATFDFILQPEARLKILEGFYDARSGKKFSTERDFDANAEIEGIFKEAKRGITANQ